MNQILSKENDFVNRNLSTVDGNNKISNIIKN
jgi:hypothetical protein